MSETLRKLIADFIYEADWEISPRPRNGFNEHYMDDEEEVVTAIIQVVSRHLTSKVKNDD